MKPVEPIYRNPKPTVDIIIELKTGIVLIERKNEPFGWALPGGFVDEGESIEFAAVREAGEETGLDILLTDLLYVYSNPLRDKRMHTISSVFIAEGNGTLQAGDDAKNARIFTSEDLPSLVFDHYEILADYFFWKKTGKKPDPASKLKMYRNNGTI
jgi:8-oxo-dGTP diphosphatase